MADKSDRARKEEQVLKFWQENKIFEKSLEKKAPKGEFVFYDGPPFATGLPHYGHILPGTIKDVIPRYKTMRGYRVPRRWGWDCHGLPIENMIEKELGLETKKDIEKYGIGEFNRRARESVLRYEKNWKEIIPRTGRWVDMEHAYKTMDSSYTESVWWSFKKLYDQGLVSQGFKSMHLCPRCETTLSNFEVNLGYKDITDISVYAKFELVDELGTYLLAWTTTPWTLPGNVALAINPEIEYVKAKTDQGLVIVAKDRRKEGFEVLETFKGKDLVGKKYKTLFDYYLKESQVYAADFVTAEEGTGIVHIAPAFGEDDYNLSLKENLPFVQHVGTDGRFKAEVTDFAGKFVKPKEDPSNPSGQAHQSGDVEIIKYLAAKNLLFAKEKITHSYPHCWRCDTPLLNYASSSWFIKVTEIKDKLVAANKKVKWLPEDIRDGRFGKWLEGARDWAVSRSRFWGTPIPVWQNADGSQKLIVDSVETLKKYSKKSGNTYWVMRHGESDNVVAGVPDTVGDPNNHLTERGKEQVKKQVQSLKEIDLILSSPFPRTKETAEIVKSELGLKDSELVIVEDLREVNPGEDLRIRMGRVIFDIDRTYSNRNILVVSHGMPLWALKKVMECKETKNFTQGDQPGLAEVKEMDFIPFPHNENFELDLHRPYIDELVLEKDGEEYRRVPEVFDTWYDSGSVPFASRGARDFKPADFIAEGLDQTRGWFYTMAVLGTALFGASPYKQVVVNGLVLAEDGKKMSKRLNNYPELTDVLDRYGGDALRYYLLSSPAVRAEDLAFSEKGLDEVVKKIINRLDNVVSFYELYKGKSSELAPKNKSFFGIDYYPKKMHVLDEWLYVRFSQLLKEVTHNLENYELDKASRPIEDFIEDLSTWYLRRSRTRSEAIPVLRFILQNLAVVMAPFMPFLAEDVYQRVKGKDAKESVHLEEWGKEKIIPNFHNRAFFLDWMNSARKIVTLALDQRQKANIKVRQPLQKLFVKKMPFEEYLEIIKEEINVKEILEDKTLETEVKLDTTLTPELEEEGRVRDAIRAVQEWRKENNLKPGEKATYPTSEEFFFAHKDEIEKATQVELSHL